ncbi:MAG: tRNA-dihydrouridine synthase [Candidatus Magasanikbacteria bacterium]|nr:tRNA-dihydrouridine synthase [Candidatus Magasanikbacteria bacterium]
MLKPIIALAPMADYTDRPFCLLCREISGTDFVIYREMVSSVAIVRDNEKTLSMCEIDRREHPVIIQIFGDDPSVMARAAKIIVERFQPDGIDINMGCPVPKVAQKTKSGAALMKYPDLAVEIVRAIKNENLGVPLSVKTRLGWSNDGEIFDFAKRLEKAGVELIAIHGRTKVQGYSGESNWQRIGEVKKILGIPVVANGDIHSKEDIEKCLSITGADGVMIGRGALGNPWIFAKSSESIGLKQIVKTIIRHAELHIEHYGDRGIVTLRKHLVWYFNGDRTQGVSGIKKLRAELVRISNLDELNAILSSL